MVVVEVSSGLGNQLFQHAAATSLALKHGVDVVYDAWAFSDDLKRDASRALRRPFVLQQIGLASNVRCDPPRFLCRLRGGLRLRRLWYDGMRPVYQCGGEYSEAFERQPANVLLRGYFQDRRYFLADCRQIVESIDHHLSRTIGNIERIDSAIHVRRGDYLNHPEFFPDRMERYVRTLIPWMLANCGVRTIHVFSDDIAWCRQELAELSGALVFEDSDPSLGGAVDLYRMSHARVLAIANSTFSWWSGQLAEHRGSRVIAPPFWSSWCADPRTRLYPDNWMVFDG